MPWIDVQSSSQMHFGRTFVGKQGCQVVVGHNVPGPEPEMKSKIEVWTKWFGVWQNLTRLSSNVVYIIQRNILWCHSVTHIGIVLKGE